MDVVDRYLEQAAFVKTALDIGDSVEFRNVGVYDLDPDEVGRFDVTFFFGLLYHLENPVLAMRKVSAVTDHVLVVDTNTILTGDKQETPLWRMSFPSPVTSPDDPLASTGLWRNREYCELKPNAAAVTGLLDSVGSTGCGCSNRRRTVCRRSTRMGTARRSLLSRRPHRHLW